VDKILAAHECRTGKEIEQTCDVIDPIKGTRKEETARYQQFSRGGGAPTGNIKIPSSGESPKEERVDDSDYRGHPPSP